MEKELTREKFENPQYMTRQEIQETYKSNWIMLGNVVWGPRRELIGGKVLAVADRCLLNQEDGFYDEFMDDKYIPVTYIDNTPYYGFMFTYGGN